ncbi:MAG: hypothetical protein IPM97_12510 [Bdellovibrionaceae bacterium]|nr:hypothetical protein [Pseudobdellovibrionaceae bacterium]
MVKLAYLMVKYYRMASLKLVLFTAAVLYNFKIFNTLLICFFGHANI